MALIGTLAADDLADTKIGGPFKTSVRIDFTAGKTVTVDHLQLFFITPAQQIKVGKPGYAGGDGGTFAVEVYWIPPSVSTTYVFLAGGLLDKPVDPFPVLQLSDTITLQQGSNYAIWVRNIHPDSLNNYSALDSMYVGDGTRQILSTGGDLYLAAVSDVQPPSQRIGYVPIWSFTGPNGAQLSSSWMEVEYASVKPWAKEVIVLNEDAKISQIMVRPLPLKVDGKTTTQGWLTIPYDRSVKAGVPFEIVLEGKFLPIRKGTLNGFPDPMPGWHAEYSADGKTWAPLNVPTDISIVLSI